MNVAVIGAGAAGLATANELLIAGHRVQVFEQAPEVGGLWNHTPEVEDDLLGQRPERRIGSSLYDSLRVNLPRDLMAFDGYPFERSGRGGDLPRYPRHDLVLRYLEGFAADNGISAHIRHCHRVETVERVAPGRWRVDGERFDAVAVCNGHFSEPIVPDIEGCDGFEGLKLHSHNYRRPDAFRGRRVALLGTSVSGHDLAREVAEVAAAVYLCGRLYAEAPPAKRQQGPFERHPPVVRFEGRNVVLANGETIADLDAFVFCTGYHYRFPFLSPSLVEVRDNWVRGLYRQLVLIDAPSCALIGLPFRIVPFPFFQRQARWFARSLSGAFRLPGLDKRRREYRGDIARLESLGIALRHYHRLGDGQIAYLNALASQCGDRPVADWFVALWREHSANAQRYPGDYRDRALANRAPLPPA